MRRFLAGILVLGVATTGLFASSDPPKKKAKPAAKHGPTVTEQLQTVNQQLTQQQQQIKTQQDQINQLQQQLQQSNSQVQQLQQQNQQMQSSVQQADAKATGAQQAANAASSGLTEAKLATDAVAQKATENQKTIDKMLHPENYLPELKVVPAVAPLRVLPIDPPKKGGLVAAFHAGGVSITPYGFIKSTAVEDSSSPRGDDFPLPGFVAGFTNTFGSTVNPEFHLKARSTRMGVNFEWPDLSKKLVLTGRVEADFEGNFSRADNRNVSTARSNALQLRLAYVRMDYEASDKSDIFFEAGQNWTLFGSSAFGNLLETTFFGAYWGQTYERDPQMRLGFVQKISESRDVKFSPEFAIMLPLEGLPPAGCTATVQAINGIPVTVPTVCGSLSADSGIALGNQLGYGERQGPDANRPGFQARAVLQWQLDKAPGVASAQVGVTGFETVREAIVTGTEVSDAAALAVDNHTLTAAQALTLTHAFPDGRNFRSKGYGIQAFAQLPTRWITLVGSAYRGGDLRFMFGGQLTSIYNNTGAVGPTLGTLSVPSIDGATTQVFALNAAGVPTLVPQRPVRGYGGFVSAGLPLSRWFNANPAGRNAGWQLYLQYGLDAAYAHDFRLLHDGLAAGPFQSHMAAGTLYWKFNRWCMFGYEQSLYWTLAQRATAGADAGTFIGAATGIMSGARQWRDLREEFGPIFTF